MNLFLILIGIMYIAYSVYITITTKSIEILWLSIPLLFIAYVTFGAIKIGESVSHQEPLKVFIDNGTLVVLDSNENLYIDTAYVRGKVCIDIHTSHHMSKLLRSSESSRSLNTKCQNED